MGNGTDIVYHGKTEFRGIHNQEVLSLSPFQQQKFKASVVSDLYPEYFILKVNDFNRWSKVPLEQWIYSLNTGDIPEDADAPGLQEAREALRITRMSKAELESYYRHLSYYPTNQYPKKKFVPGPGTISGRRSKKCPRAWDKFWVGTALQQRLPKIISTNSPSRQSA